MNRRVVFHLVEISSVDAAAFDYFRSFYDPTYEDGCLYPFAKAIDPVHFQEGLEAVKAMSLVESPEEKFVFELAEREYVRDYLLDTYPEYMTLFDQFNAIYGKGHNGVLNRDPEEEDFKEAYHSVETEWKTDHLDEEMGFDKSIKEKVFDRMIERQSYKIDMDKVKVIY